MRSSWKGAALFLGTWCLNAAAEGPDVYLWVNKQANELSVFSLEEPTRVLKKFRAISGSSLGDKEKEGDRKTPEGIYFLEREVPRSRLTALHGAAAFELNYPNPYDRIHGRTGYGIWIHGVDNEERMQKRFDTQGCVALSNQDVLELRQWVGSQRMTPVIVVDQAGDSPRVPVEDGESPLGQRVKAWVEAWSSKDADRYLSFYDARFHARGMGFDQWSRYKRRLTRQYKHIQVSVESLRIFRHEKYSVALFKQYYQSNRFASKGWKRLYLMGDGAEAKILSEEMRREVALQPDLSDDERPATARQSSDPASTL